MKKSALNLKIVIPVLLSFFVMSFVDLVGIGVDRAKADFQLSDTMAQLIPSAAFLWFFLLSVPAGILQDRYGKKHMLNYGMTMSAIGMIVPFIFYSFPVLLIGFALLGIGNTVIQVSANPLLVSVVPPKRASSALSFSQFIKSIGSMLGAPMAGFMAARFGDWKLALLAFGIVSMLTVLWLGAVKIEEEKGTADHFPDRPLCRQRVPPCFFHYRGCISRPGQRDLRADDDGHFRGSGRSAAYRLADGCGRDHHRDVRPGGLCGVYPGGGHHRREGPQLR